MFTRTLLDFKAFEEEEGITTSSIKLDKLISKGIPLGVVTEVAGEPGSGKTQLCMQLCVNIQIPKSLKGAEGSAIFIDTSHGFNPQRLAEIIKGQTLLQQEDPKLITDKIHYALVTSLHELLAAIHSLKKMVVTTGDVKLIVVDSICYLFREVPYRIDEKIRLMLQMVTDLCRLAYEHHIAVVITNDVATTKKNGGAAKIMPALGDAFSARVPHRFLVTKLMHEPPGHCAAQMVKSQRAPALRTIKFKIAESGVTDVI